MAVARTAYLGQLANSADRVQIGLAQGSHGQHGHKQSQPHGCQGVNDWQVQHGGQHGGAKDP